jgi:copper chaperone
MIKEKINVENIKCHGCANTIRKEIAKLDGVKKVEVDVENACVTVDLDETVQNKENVVKRLTTLGYPEQGENSLKSKVVSYVSCAVGRVSGE